ncbi:transcriptional regulator [Actinotalea sp.]|uniref:transcriptional regulator n=1 Tax=Actinotalea sp. TaxID=1872145 RepID=UPI002C6F0D7C|nr:transcriptional regulator [Actinotalea sp.]HQY34741.1 transcriptional regulator [Actinotalea sp.]HRA50751.1 transcriptional regulator [Actinotalea sp.]
MVVASSPELLVLHALRLRGMADDGAVARRFGIAPAVAGELLLDAQARGWVRRVGFVELSGWALSDAGRAELGGLLAAELAATGERAVVEATHADFGALNTRLLTAATRWQIRPLPGDPLAVNDHTDARWDDRVLDELGSLLRAVVPLTERLTAVLPRCDGYPERLALALTRAERGERSWVDRPGSDSFHGVWFELHEDLLATLGIERGAED